jgi:hypothetical protein
MLAVDTTVIRSADKWHEVLNFGGFVCRESSQLISQLLSAFQGSIKRRVDGLKAFFVSVAGVQPTWSGSDIEIYLYYHDHVLSAALNALTTGPIGQTSNNDDYESFLIHVELLNFLQDRALYLFGVESMRFAKRVATTGNFTAESSVYYDHELLNVRGVLVVARCVTMTVDECM